MGVVPDRREKNTNKKTIIDVKYYENRHFGVKTECGECVPSKNRVPSDVFAATAAEVNADEPPAAEPPAAEAPPDEDPASSATGATVGSGIRKNV